MQSVQVRVHYLAGIAAVGEVGRIEILHMGDHTPAGMAALRVEGGILQGEDTGGDRNQFESSFLFL